MLVPSVLIFATAAVTAVLVREKLRWHEAGATFAAFLAAYVAGVYAFTPARFAEGLWLGAVPLAAYALTFTWYRFKRGWVSAAFFIIVPPAAVITGYILAGPFAVPASLKGALFSAAWTTGYKGLTVARLARLLFILSGLLYLSSPANAVIKGVLSRLGVFPAATERDTEADTARRGAIIGTLERWIAFVLVLTAQYAALAFIIAAKAIARYKKINEEEKFGEYFLIGTLASIGIALFFGLIVKRFFV